jgi:hypothetical protein
VSDVFLVKSLATAAGKAVIKGGATLLARQAAKEAARLAAKEAAEQAAKLAAKEAAEQAAKEAAEQAAKEAAEQAAKEAAEQAAKKAAEQAAKDAAKKAAERAASDVADRTAGEVAGHTGAGAGQGGSKLLHAGKAGSVVANKLLKHEIQFAKEIVAHRGGKLIGMARRSAPGIDALLEGAPISLKETKGGLLSVLRHASAAEAQAKAAGYAGVELFIKAENVELAKLLDFASKGGLKGGLSKIPTQGIISAINVLTKNGWVRFIP